MTALKNLVCALLGLALVPLWIAVATIITGFMAAWAIGSIVWALALDIPESLFSDHPKYRIAKMFLG